MPILTVLEYPDKRLRTEAKPVATIDATIQRIVADMFETMYAQKAVGLAATQVDIHQRILVMDISDNGNEPICLINPEIVMREGTQYEHEGCISFPGMYDKVERAAVVEVHALNPEGESIQLKADGLQAICIQHEMDHLDGVLFIDHLSRMKRDRLCKKLEKSRNYVE